MKLVTFHSNAHMQQQALALLGEHFCAGRAAPHAVMLSGGRTPQGLYRALQQAPPRVDGSLHLLLSDERHVAPQSPESNYGAVQPMVRALRLDESRVMRVRTELPLAEAADDYHRQLASFLEAGGRITLGLLGLGDDGHTASLFSVEDLRRGAGRYALAVPRSDGPDRVSVTGDLLRRIERLVFLAAGPEKAEIVRKAMCDPAGVVAVQAVQRAANVELWYAEERAPPP